VAPHDPGEYVDYRSGSGTPWPLGRQSGGGIAAAAAFDGWITVLADAIVLRGNRVLSQSSRARQRCLMNSTVRRGCLLGFEGVQRAVVDVQEPVGDVKRQWTPHLIAASWPASTPTLGAGGSQRSVRAFAAGCLAFGVW
jgi:hypothetical protein